MQPELRAARAVARRHGADARDVRAAAATGDAGGRRAAAGDGGRPDAAVGCYYPTRDDSVYFDCDATTEGKLRVCYCDDGLPQWLKRKKNDNHKGKVGDDKHKVQLRHGALQPEKVLWGDSRGARRRRD